MKTTVLKSGTFMGQTQKKRVVNGFILSRTGHACHHTTPKHEHEHPYISLLLHGSYREQWSGDERFMKPGYALYRPGGFEHLNEMGTLDTFCFNLEIEGSYFENLLSERLSDPFLLEHNNLELHKLYYAFQSDYSNELLHLTISENLYPMLHEEHTLSTSGRSLWVNKLRREVRLNPENNYSIEGIANSLHLHPNYFVRQFKKVTGHTFGEYLLRQRISTGIDQMIHTSKSLTQIALDSGFYDQSHFIKHFRQFFGTTPSQYRKMAKG